MNIFVLFLFNFFINSLLVFATTWLLVELFLYIFRIKNFRVKYFARLLPLFKVFLDLAIYNFSCWSLLQNINPLLCEKGTRHFTITLGLLQTFGKFLTIFFHLSNHLTFTISDMLSHFLGKYLTLIIVILLSMGCIISLFKFCITLITSKVLHKKTIKNFKEQNLPIFKSLIKNKFSLKKVSFGIVLLKISPCIIRYKKKWLVIFPKNFDKFLSKNEIKSILQHEMQHIINFDYYFSIFYGFLQSILWFNPLIALWKRKISITKELACDQNTKNDPLYLATALKKFATRSTINLPLMNSFFNKNTLLIRIKALANQKTKKHCKFFKYFQYAVLIIISIVLFYSKLWIF